MSIANKAYILSTINRLYREDPWVNQLYNAAGIELDKLEAFLDEIFGNNFFDTATEKAVEYFEYELNETPLSTDTLQERKQVIRADWVGSGKATLQMLQAVADSWENGLVTLTFESGKIKVTFNSPVGIPENLDALKEAFETVKPAHLAIYYVFLYLYWQDCLDAGTWQTHYDNGDWAYVKAH